MLTMHRQRLTQEHKEAAMKKNYETAEINIFLFKKPDVVVASGTAEPNPDVAATTIDSDETEIL